MSEQIKEIYNLKGLSMRHRSEKTIKRAGKPITSDRTVYKLQPIRICIKEGLRNQQISLERSHQRSYEQSYESRRELKSLSSENKWMMDAKLKLLKQLDNIHKQRQLMQVLEHDLRLSNQSDYSVYRPLCKTPATSRYFFIRSTTKRSFKYLTPRAL